VPAAFRPFDVHLACRVSARDPHRVLELAAPSGVLTRSDLNAAMVDLGSRQVSGAQWRQADAMHHTPPQRV
jgi:hypothetical protein